MTPQVQQAETDEADAGQACKRLGCDLDAGGHDPSGRAGGARHLGIQDVAEDAVTVVSGLADRHGPEVEMVKDIAETRVNFDCRQSKLRDVAGKIRGPEIGG